jgi:hypothetical protein
VNAVDSMLRQLYLVRGRLVREIRTADDATAGGGLMIRWLFGWR